MNWMLSCGNNYKRSNKRKRKQRPNHGSVYYNHHFLLLLLLFSFSAALTHTRRRLLCVCIVHALLCSCCWKYFFWLFFYFIRFYLIFAFVFYVWTPINSLTEKTARQIAKMWSLHLFASLICFFWKNQTRVLWISEEEEKNKTTTTKLHIGDYMAIGFRLHVLVCVTGKFTTVRNWFTIDNLPLMLCARALRIFLHKIIFNIFWVLFFWFKFLVLPYGYRNLNVCCARSGSFFHNHHKNLPPPFLDCCCASGQENFPVAVVFSLRVLSSPSRKNKNFIWKNVQNCARHFGVYLMRVVSYRLRGNLQWTP